MAHARHFYVYILTNWNGKVMYIGITNDLQRRIFEHRNKLVPGFTAKYNLARLVYVEETTDVVAALAREKEIKKWRRIKKDDLVRTLNPTFSDLSCDWFEDPSLQHDNQALRPNARGPLEDPSLRSG